MTVREVLRVDVADVAPAGVASVAVEVVAPALGQQGEHLPVLACFPGGGMNRAYFDLDVAGYSFAEFAAERGHTVLLIDHPGVGESDVPEDGWTLTPRAVAAVDAAAAARALALLRSGDVRGLLPRDRVAMVAVGHSAGAGLVIHQQALTGLYDGIALLGWSHAGMPSELTDAERKQAGAEPVESVLVGLAQERFNEPLPVLGGGGAGRMLLGGEVPPEVRAALIAARTRLLTLAGHAAMIPGSASDATRSIDVPVFLGVGERDIAVDHHLLPAEFPASRDVTLTVLPGAGHNHNAEPARELLWSRLVGWAGAVTQLWADAEAPAAATA